MYYSFLNVLTHVTTHVTVCVICHAEIKGYLRTYLLTLQTLSLTDIQQSVNDQERTISQ